MVDDRVQINKEVLLELCTFIREKYPTFDAAGKYQHLLHMFEFACDNLEMR